MDCRICGEPNLFTALNLGQQPLANKYPSLEHFASEKFYPLKVLSCLKCKCFQLETIISREEMFVDYYYLSSVNQGLVRHFNALAKQIAIYKPNIVVDIGSNDGVLLQPLKDLGITAIGVEPSKNVSQIAMEKNLSTYVGFFDHEAVETIMNGVGKVDVIVASSVFTHLEDPHLLIRDVRDLLTDKGTFIIEVEYIKNIVDTCQFERFYFDRIFYYSLTSLVSMFNKNGMKIVDSEIIDTHGGSLRVTAVRNDNNSKQPSDRFKELLLAEEELNIDTIVNFNKDTRTYAEMLYNKLEQYKAKGLMVVGYGAPARVSTICNYAHINDSLISYIVDDSKLKQNKFSPGTHIPILPYMKYKEDEQKIDVVVLFAYEYFDDIKKKTPGVMYVIPIPPKEIMSTEAKPILEPVVETLQVMASSILSPIMGDLNKND